MEYLFMKKTLLNGLRFLSVCILLMFASGVEPLHADTSTDPLNISKYKGQVIYLDFWASWCGPCRLSFPYMEQIQSYYKSKGLVLLAVNVDHSRDKADAFLARFGPDMPVVFDSKGKIAAAYHVGAMPTSILIDRKGHIRYVQSGFFPDQVELYESHISGLINER
jgi:cytochrome c biogenesis protein CcmG/thiol:disulfide interchange protein DsbE